MSSTALLNIPNNLRPPPPPPPPLAGTGVGTWTKQAERMQTRRSMQRTCSVLVACGPGIARRTHMHT
jgi:hypothetical protein